MKCTSYRVLRGQVFDHAVGGQFIVSMACFPRPSRLLDQVGNGR